MFATSLHKANAVHQSSENSPTNSNVFDFKSEVETILNSYQRIAAGDPLVFRHKIPATEVWRFFVDKQFVHGRGIVNLKTSPWGNSNEKSMFYASISKCNWKCLDFMNNDDPSGAYQDYLQHDEFLKLDKAWMPFESNEPGYLQAMYSAFTSVYDFTPLNANTIRKIHAQAMHGVTGANYLGPYSERTAQSKKFRSTEARFGLSQANTTQLGMHEAIEDTNLSKGASFILTLRDGSLAVSQLVISNESLASINLHKEKISALFHSLKQKTQTNISMKFLGTNCFLLKEDIEQKNAWETSSVKLAYDIGYIRDNTQVTPQQLEIIYKLSQLPDMFALAEFLYNDCLSNPEIDLKFRGLDSNVIDDALDRALEIYHDNIQTDDPLQILDAIIEVVRTCERNHNFGDGNCRTFCMTMLNRELAQNGFPLCIMENANSFEMFDFESLRRCVIQGMKNTFELIETSKLYGIVTQEITEYLYQLKKDKNIYYYDYFSNACAIETLSRESNPKTREQIILRELNNDLDYTRTTLFFSNLLLAIPNLNPARSLPKLSDLFFQVKTNDFYSTVRQIALKKLMALVNTEKPVYQSVREYHLCEAKKAPIFNFGNTSYFHSNTEELILINKTLKDLETGHYHCKR